MARTTDSDPAVRAAPNRLLGPPDPVDPNRVWVGEITYLPQKGGGCHSPGLAEARLEINHHIACYNA